MCIHLPFKYRKAVQVLNYFAVKSGGRINEMKALKLVFLSDRFHLRKYGRPITNDEYFAMPFGPVASGVKDIAEFSFCLDKSEDDYARQFLARLNQFTIESKSNVNQKVFSKSDLEAMEYAWVKFGKLSKYELSDLTHEYPEWKKHEEFLQKFKRVKMSYEDFFEDPPAGVDKCFDLTLEEKTDRLAYLKENSNIEAAWCH